MKVSSNAPRAKVVQLAVRIPFSWLTRLDALIPKIAQEGVQTTRTDAIRVALAKGLDSFESSRARAKATRGATEVALAKGLDSRFRADDQATRSHQKSETV